MIARISQPEILFANELATEVFGLRIGPQRDAIRAAYLDPSDRKRLIERLVRDGRVDGFEVQTAARRRQRRCGRSCRRARS